jgi:hypothetical protein
LLTDTKNGIVTETVKCTPPIANVIQAQKVVWEMRYAVGGKRYVFRKIGCH